ncbi:disco-interacting protein 2 homolog C-like isoform X3 [Macaca nemestrina]|uniref:disco-interacting protein 2 homolog C-like isoform X3 n=2 Tax=Macaca nemestrina TaxID=9545 RepID=UPI0039B8B62B
MHFLFRIFSAYAGFIGTVSSHDVHTEAVQAALARHKERKMAVPVPSKRRSLVVQTSMDAYTPPDTSSGSEDEGSVQGDSQGTPTSSQGCITMEHWISQAIHGSTTSTTSSTSSSSMQSGGSRAAHRLAEVMAQTHIENHSAPPDVTTYTSEHSIQMERPQGSTGSRTAPEYGNAELMETSGVVLSALLEWMHPLPDVCGTGRADHAVSRSWEDRESRCVQDLQREVRRGAAFVVFRPTDDSNQPPGWGVLSMHGLTYGVIRLDSEEKLSVLTMQDVSLVMPGGRRFVSRGHGHVGEPWYSQ